jgi:hypothetical protein
LSERSKLEEYFSKELSTANSKHNQVLEAIRNEAHREKLTLLQELATFRDQLVTLPKIQKISFFRNKNAKKFLLPQIVTQTKSRS